MQAPFLTVFMYISENPEYEKETVMLIEEMLKQRIKGMQNEKGEWITPAFPKLIYALDENNITEDSEYFYLTKLASECIAKRMMPDLLSVKVMKENYDGNVFPPMGCRSFLSPWKDEFGNYKWYGRGNMGITTLNLADCGLSADGDIDEFWKILDDRLELCKESLLLRYEKLKSVTSDASPIHWQYGGICRLPKHTPIQSKLEGGYFTISLGYIGIYECVMALIGESHTTEKGHDLAIDIMNRMRDAVDSWKRETGLGFGLYGTPAESLTYKFARTCRERFGVVEGITDKDYLTNSYHVNVTEKINAFDKLKFESEFQAISSGGAISYIETPSMLNNLDAVVTLMQFMYENIQYAELNTKLDYCTKCGFQGELICHDDMSWECPDCGNTDKLSLVPIRRVCGLTI